MKNIELYCDGACRSNPGPGGYGTILKYKNREKEISGGEPETTNNRMELRALIEGLKCLKESCHITVYTDSQYVSNGISKGWAKSWKKNNWKKPDKKPALNSDLWDELLNLLEDHEVDIVWIKGHAGHEMNERCDRLAVAESLKFPLPD